jgi:hypothetical protein
MLAFVDERHLEARRWPEYDRIDLLNGANVGS